MIQNYNRVISKNPRNINAYINRGIAYYRQGKYDQAITNYTQAIGISKNIHAYINRGIAYHRQGKYDLAIADYNQALSINSINVVVFINNVKTLVTNVLMFSMDGMILVSSFHTI